MKTEFIANFLLALGEIGYGIGSAFRRETLGMKMMRGAGYDPKKFYHGFKNLHRRKIIHVTGDNVYALTSEGQRWFRYTSMRYKIYPKKAWDRKWRVVVFDIPQELHNARNRLRQKLKYLGFYILQKSIYVFPFPCETEVAELGSDLKLNDYIDILIAERIGAREKKIRKWFGL